MRKAVSKAKFYWVSGYTFAQKSVEPAAPSKKPEYITKSFDKVAYMDYKTHTTIKHNDPKSPEYIPSVRDDYYNNVLTTTQNKQIDDLKRNMKIQTHVHNILRKMDRPYLRGQPGNTRNVSSFRETYHDSQGIDQSFLDFENTQLENFNRNEDRWQNDNIYEPKYAKMTHYDVEFQKEKDSRPTTKNINPDKGYKHDVITPYNERYDYLADRLGHPEILGTPVERLLRLESEMYHPCYLDQPFVKMPKPEPHPSLNFEEGEVLYENTRLQEWFKFLNYGVHYGLAWCAVFVPYQLLFKTHMPMDHALDNLFFPYYNHTMYYWDSNNIHIPVVSLSLMYTCYVGVSNLHRVLSDYVIRA